MIKIKIDFKKTGLLFLLLFSFAYTNAQSRKTIDSLMTVKNYLLTIKSTIPQNTAAVPKAIKKLDSLIHLGTQKKALFDSQLAIVLKDNPTEKKELLRKYDFVLQSSILIKTHLNQGRFKTTETKKEMHYLYESSAFLVDNIYFYANYYERKTAEILH